MGAMAAWKPESWGNVQTGTAWNPMSSNLMVTTDPSQATYTSALSLPAARERLREANK